MNQRIIIVYRVETFDRKIKAGPLFETKEEALRELRYQRQVHPERSWCITEIEQAG